MIKGSKWRWRWLVGYLGVHPAVTVRTIPKREIVLDNRPKPR